MHTFPRLLLLAALVCLATRAVADDRDVAIVDCHVHLWTLERPEAIYWVKEENKVLRRNFLPSQHRPIAKANGVRAVVVVQAGQHLPDNQWNLDVTARDKSLYRGVVGNLSKVIGTDEFQPLFEKLCRDERYVGYRLSGRYREWLSDELFRDLRATAKAGRTVDFLVGGYTLAEIDEIAGRIPELKIILDHFGGVRLDGKPLDPEYVKGMKAIARRPNVSCKVSALYGRWQKQPAPKTIESYKPVLDLVFEAFGPDRLVYGSDWPVTRTSGDYASVVALTRRYFDDKGADVVEKLFWTNAVEFYGIPKDVK